MTGSENVGKNLVGGSAKREALIYRERSFEKSSKTSARDFLAAEA